MMIDGIPKFQFHRFDKLGKQEGEIRRACLALIGPTSQPVLHMWHLLHLIFKPTVILYVGIWLCLKIWYTMVYP